MLPIHLSRFILFCLYWFMLLHSLLWHFSLFFFLILSVYLLFYLQFGAFYRFSSHSVLTECNIISHTFGTVAPLLFRKIHPSEMVHKYRKSLLKRCVFFYSSSSSSSFYMQCICLFFFLNCFFCVALQFKS